MTYREAVQSLYSLGNEIKAARLGLDRMLELAAALGDPHHGRAFVHVAGTNGKGSTCAMIEAGLRTAGVRTGLYTSPHLVEPTERIRINGEPVSREQFTAAFERVHREAERLIAAGAIEQHPTYFETVTAMGFALFRERGAEMTVLEVGLGGRLDATNIVLPRVAVVTPVDFDHEAFLGKSLEAIASEKAGILKPGVRAVIARQRPEVAGVLRRAAPEAAWAPDFAIEDLELTPRGSRFRAAGMLIECPLAGAHQVENALTAALALRALGIPPDGIRNARWPGRLERVRERPEIVLDGAHNPAGARALARHIVRFYSQRRVWLIYGAMRDKAVGEMAAILFPAAHEVIATAPEQSRAVKPETIAAIADHPRLRTAPSVAAALEMACASAAPDDAVFVSGSLFLVGEARALLVK